MKKIKELYKLYKSGLTTYQLAEREGVSDTTIRRWFKSAGYETRHAGPQTKPISKFKVLNNKLKCYWFGFLSGKLVISDRFMSIMVPENKGVYLKKLASFLGLETSAKKYRGSVKLNICHPELAKDLADHGLCRDLEQRKFPCSAMHYDSMIEGLWDACSHGDSFCSSNYFVTEVGKYLQRHKISYAVIDSNKKLKLIKNA